MLELLKKFEAFRIGKPNKRSLLGLNPNSLKCTRKHVETEWEIESMIASKEERKEKHRNRFQKRALHFDK